VSFDALFDITGDTLTLTLTNTSSTASLNPDDTLSSFYFDIMNGSNVRPDLVYVSATGSVYSRISGKRTPSRQQGKQQKDTTAYPLQPKKREALQHGASGPDPEHRDHYQRGGSAQPHR